MGEAVQEELILLELLHTGPIGYSKTSVTKYHSTLRNIPEERGISFTPRRKPEITQKLSSYRNDGR
jgi:hypothetical protein